MELELAGSVLFFRQCVKITFLFSDGPSLVYVNVFVRSFSSIDDVKMVSTLLSVFFENQETTFKAFLLVQNVKYFNLKLN